LFFVALHVREPNTQFLAPNDHLREMTPDAVQRDIDECMRLASSHPETISC